MTLLPWPKACDYQPYPSEPDTEGAQLRYQRALAQRALQGLRVAVEALERYRSWVVVMHEPEFRAESVANDALVAIGDLPPCGETK
jgi:hypothetical protein